VPDIQVNPRPSTAIFLVHPITVHIGQMETAQAKEKPDEIPTDSTRASKRARDKKVKHADPNPSTQNKSIPVTSLELFCHSPRKSDRVIDKKQSNQNTWVGPYPPKLAKKPKVSKNNTRSDANANSAHIKGMTDANKCK
jgi:hypothetical protein